MAEQLVADARAAGVHGRARAASMAIAVAAVHAVAVFAGAVAVRVALPQPAPVRHGAHDAGRVVVVAVGFGIPYCFQTFISSMRYAM